jgi:hypothetical protein
VRSFTDSPTVKWDIHGMLTKKSKSREFSVPSRLVVHHGSVDHSALRVSASLCRRLQSQLYEDVGSDMITVFSIADRQGQGQWAHLQGADGEDPIYMARSHIGSLLQRPSRSLLWSPCAGSGRREIGRRYAEPPDWGRCWVIEGRHAQGVYYSRCGRQHLGQWRANSAAMRPIRLPRHE